MLNFDVFYVDVDECNDSVCHTNALCTNTNGSYLCTCKDGFTGNGTYCEGKCLNSTLLRISIVQSLCRCF